MTSNSQHQSILLGAFSSEVVGAIRGVAREEAEAVFSDNRTQLEQLAARVEEIFARQGSTPQVRQAAQAVADGLDANQAASQGAPSHEAAQADAARVQQVADAVDRAENPQPSRPAGNRGGGNDNSLEGRVCVLEEALPGIRASVEGAHTSARSAQGTASRAMAVAIAMNGGGSRKTIAVRVFAGVLVASAIVYWLLAIGRGNSLDWNWFDQVAWPVGLAAAVSYIVYLFLPTQEERQARADARASAGHQPAEEQGDDHGILGIFRGHGARGQAHSSGGNGAQAGANANAGHGHSHAGADASAH